MQSVFFLFVCLFVFFFLRWDLVCRPASLAKTVETGDKNRDDFHCIEMSLVMRMQFISVMTEMTHVSLAMT